MRERTLRRRARERTLRRMAKARRTRRTRGFRPRRSVSRSSGSRSRSSGSRSRSSGSVENPVEFLGKLREEILRKQAELSQVSPNSMDAFVLNNEIASLQQQEQYLAAELNPV